MHFDGFKPYHSNTPKNTHSYRYIRNKEGTNHLDGKELCEKILLVVGHCNTRQTEDTT